MNEHLAHPVLPQAAGPITGTSRSNSPSIESATMTTLQTSTAAPAAAAFNLNAMRLPANYGATLGVKKVLNTVHVGKPDKARFIRVRDGDEWVFGCFIVQLKELNETYLALPHVAYSLGALARPAQLHAAIDRHGNLSLIPVFLPGEDGKRNPWHESLAQAVELAKTHWVRIVANMGIGGYDVLQAQGALADPVWSETTMEELITVGFRGKIIDTENHPVILGLLGSV